MYVERSCWHITIGGRQPRLEKIYKTYLSLLIPLTFRSNYPFALLARSVPCKSSLFLTFTKFSHVRLFYKCFFFPFMITSYSTNH